MNERDIAEQAYNNGYEKGYADAKAEIDRLNKEVDRLSQCVLYHDWQIADTIKEFGEKVFQLFPTDKNFTTISRFAIKRILNEMAGAEPPKGE